MKCYKCSYEWKARLENPKSCPRCKTRFDNINLMDNGNNGKLEDTN